MKKEERTTDLTIRRKEAVPSFAEITELMIQKLKEQKVMLKRFVKEVLEDGEDVIKIEGKDYLCKGAWRKLARAMNINTKLLNSGEKVISKDDLGEYYVWKFKAKAWWNDGRECTTVGACSSRDSFFAKVQGEWRRQSEIDETDIINTAQSNAVSRAISELIGFVDIPAEEMLVKRKKEIKFKTKTDASSEKEKNTISDMKKRKIVVHADCSKYFDKLYSIAELGGYSKEQVDSKLIENYGYAPNVDQLKEAIKKLSENVERKLELEKKLFENLKGQFNQEKLDEIIQETIGVVKPSTIDHYKALNERLSKIIDEQMALGDVELIPPEEEYGGN